MSTPNIYSDAGRGARLVAARESVNKSQKGAAADIGVSGQQLGRWEKGEPIPEDRLLQLSALYGVSPAKLRYGADVVTTDYADGLLDAAGEMSRTVAALIDRAKEARRPAIVGKTA